MTEIAKAVTPATVYHNVFYPSPPSVHAEDWTSNERFTTRVFRSDFCHGNHITLNTRLPTLKAGYLKATQGLRWTGGALRVEDQLRLWFPLTWRPNSFIYVHSLDDKVRVHYDHGYVRVNNYDVNLYGSLDFLKNWTNVNARLGVSHTCDKVFTNFRLRVDQNKDTTLYHKTQLKLNEWKIGFQFATRLNHNFALLKKDLVLGYEHKDISVYLQGNQSWSRPTTDFNNWRQFFSTVSLTTLYRRGLRQLYGLQVIADPERRDISSVTGLVEYQQSHNNRVKAKINNKFLLTFFLERRLNNQLTVALGAEVPLNRKVAEGERKAQNKVGLKLSFNL